MTRVKQLLMGLAGMAVVATASAAAPMSPPKIVVVLHFDASNDTTKLLTLTKKAMDIYAKQGCGCNTRVWGGGFGGDGGTTIVTEFPSMVAMAQYTAKRDASPEWMQFIAEAMVAGFKSPTSSLLAEMTP